MQPTEPIKVESAELPEIVTIQIPVHRDKLIELNTACELLGMPLPNFLQENLEQAFHVQMERAKVVAQRLEAARNKSAGLGISLVDASANKSIDVARLKQKQKTD